MLSVSSQSFDEGEKGELAAFYTLSKKQNKKKRKRSGKTASVFLSVQPPVCAHISVCCQEKLRSKKSVSSLSSTTTPPYCVCVCLCVYVCVCV